MPRNASRTSDAWRTVETPQTPLQRCAFLDSCTLWLTSEPTECHESMRFKECTSTRVVPPASRTTGFAFSHSDRDRRECALCRKDDETTEAVVVNPFTQHCHISVCRDCRGNT